MLLLLQTTEESLVICRAIFRKMAVGLSPRQSTKHLSGAGVTLPDRLSFLLWEGWTNRHLDSVFRVCLQRVGADFQIPARDGWGSTGEVSNTEQFRTYYDRGPVNTGRFLPAFFPEIWAHSQNSADIYS